MSMSVRIGGILCLLLGVLPVMALEPARWASTMTQEFKTPHFDWAAKRSGKVPRVLFLTNFDGAPYQYGLLGARQVIEWVNRAGFEWTPVVVSGAIARDPKQRYLTVFADGDTWNSQCYNDGKRTDLEKQFDAALKSEYDAYVLNGVAFAALANSAKLRILKAVIGGAGLVLVRDVDTDFPKMFRTPDAAAAARLKRGGAPGFWPLEAFKLGKGRIVRIARWTEPVIAADHTGPRIYAPEWSAYFRELKGAARTRQEQYNRSPVARWFFEMENLSASALRAIDFAAGRPPVLDEVACDGKTAGVKITGDFSGTLRARIRDAENRVVHAGPLRPGSNPLPVLPRGDYALDVFADAAAGGVADFASREFSVAGGVAAKIGFSDPLARVTDGTPLAFTLELDRPVRNAAVTVELDDSPFYRTWARRQFRNLAGQSFQLKLDDWFLPKGAGILRVRLDSPEGPAAAAAPVFRTAVNHVPEWLDCLCYRTDTPLHAFSQADMGWTFITNRLDGDRPVSVANYMLYGMGMQPTGPLANSVFGNRAGNPTGFRKEAKSGNTIPDFIVQYGALNSWQPTAEMRRQVERDQQDWRKHPEIVKFIFNRYAGGSRVFDYGVEMFISADESSPVYDCMRGPFVENEFRRRLEKQFGTIGKLNAAWGRNYPSFAAIPYLTTTDAASSGKLPEGAAMRAFVEDIYFNTIFRTLGAEIQKRVPGAVYGRHSDRDNQTVAVNIPGVTGEFSHYGVPATEMQRTMRPDYFVTSLSGYEGGAAGYPNKNYYTGAVAGTTRGVNYFIDGAHASGNRNADFTDMRPRFTAARLEMASGLGPLLRRLQPVPATAAVFASTASERAALLSSDTAASPDYTCNLLFEYAGRRGVSLDRLTVEGAKTRFPRYRTLFLPGVSAVSENEARMLTEFVKNGGTVVADVNPGIYNEFLGMPANNRLCELFGDLKPASRLGQVPFAGRRIEGVAGIPAMSERKVGGGRAILLNFTLSGLRTALGDDEKYDAFLDKLFGRLGIVPPFTLTGVARNAAARLRRGDGFELAAWADDTAAEAGKSGGANVTVKFSTPGWLYECNRGFAGKGDTVRIAPFDPPFRAVARFDREQRAPELALSAETAGRGGKLELDCTRLIAGRYYTLQLRDAAGKLVRPRNEIDVHERIYADGKRKKFPVRFAYTDTPGTYTLTLTDVLTGLTSKTPITVQ